MKRTDQEIQDLAQKFSAHAGALPSGYQAAVQQVFEGALNAQNIDLDAPKPRRVDAKRKKLLSLAAQAVAGRPAPSEEDMFPVLVAPPPRRVKASNLRSTDPISQMEKQWTEAEKKAKTKAKTKK
jgi:hypothetical protein